MISLQHNMVYLTKKYDEQKPSDIFPFDQIVILDKLILTWSNWLFDYFTYVHFITNYFAKHFYY
jgi:hypothetical protein